MHNGFEYDFWLRLIRAIEEYTSIKKKSVGNYFFYKNLDFSYAFERKLYFEMFGDKSYVLQLEDRFKFSTNINLKSKTHGDIISLMYPNDNIQYQVIRKKLKSYFLQCAFNHTLTINGYLTLKTLLKNRLLHLNYSKENLIVSIHHKFIRYLEPVYNQLGNSVFVICGDIEESVELCREFGCEYIIFDSFVKFKNLPNQPILDLVISYEKIIKIITKLESKNIIIPEGNAPIYEVFNLATKELVGIKIICIQHGWSPVCHNGFRNMSYDLFLSWGNKFTNILKVYNPKQKFLATGAHKLKYKNDDKEKSAISFFDQGISTLVSENMASEFLRFAIYLAKMYPHQLIVIREHPSSKIIRSIKEEMSEFNNIRFMNSDMFELSDVLSITKIAVSSFSTTLYEAILYDSIPFSLNLTSLPNLCPSLSKNKVGIEVNNVNDASNIISELLDSKSLCDLYKSNILSFKTQYFESHGDNALKNIIFQIKKLHD